MDSMNIFLSIKLLKTFPFADFLLSVPLTPSHPQRAVDLDKSTFSRNVQRKLFSSSDAHVPHVFTV